MVSLDLRGEVHIKLLGFAIHMLWGVVSMLFAPDSENKLGMSPQKGGFQLHIGNNGPFDRELCMMQQ